MVQGGHGYPPPIKYYLAIFNRSPAKPFLETETRYEGISNAGPDDVRHAAYLALQAGSLGYTYVTDYGCRFWSRASNIRP